MNDKQYSRIQVKRDTAVVWAEENPQLLEGEIGYETDTGRYKIGRMINEELMPWNELDYSNGAITDIHSPYSYAFGKNTLAGAKGYSIEAIEGNVITLKTVEGLDSNIHIGASFALRGTTFYYWPWDTIESIDLNNKTITLKLFRNNANKLPVLEDTDSEEFPTNYLLLIDYDKNFL